MSATDRRRRPHGVMSEAVLVWSVLATTIIGAGLFTAAVHLAGALDGRSGRLAWHPITLVSDLASGRTPWPRYAIATLILVGLLAVAALVGALVWWQTRQRRRSGVDRAARLMGSGRDLERVTRGAAHQAERLGVTAGPGIALGTTVVGNQTVWQGWEDVSVAIAGPRTGKTTAMVVPAIMQAPGAVVTTSNKRDVVDATRGPRSTHGPVWVFDPQQLVDEPATWWWNPLSYVTDEVRAANLADVFAAASSTVGARTDAFFDPKGQKLVAGLLMACACAGRTIDQVYRWVTSPRDDEPVIILREHGYDLLAASVAGEINAPEKQRGGVYGTAEKILAFLTNRQALEWVTPGHGRHEFQPADFPTSRGTLYSLSREGRGSAGALVAGLTVAVTDAAEDHARRSPGGRLEVPMLVVLDEAANVCKWPELPNLYSHYGSRGIVLITILQSWSQGVDVWGRDGIRKLWSAATIKLYGGGVTEVEFLTDLSHLIGEFTNTTQSVSHGHHQRSTTHATQRERVLDVSDLAALPRGRAIVIASGTPPTLIRLQPWMNGPHRHTIEQSLAEHAPARHAVAVSPHLAPQQRSGRA